MFRSMMQVYVKDSAGAVEFYKKAFGAELLCAYPDGKGGYMHSELNAFGQIIAVSELEEGSADAGNTMMLCFDFGEGGEASVNRAYDVLRDGATEVSPVGRCDYSPCQFVLTDRYGVRWCLFV